jgi:hypothetical protein
VLGFRILLYVIMGRQKKIGWRNNKVYMRATSGLPGGASDSGGRIRRLIKHTVHDDIPFLRPTLGQHTKSSAFRGLLPYLFRMPKTPASLPLSALFGIIKPSGPTSMHVVGQLKKLVCNSRLFVDEDKLGKRAGKKRARRDNVKVGQGGTLDPLADGVLGECICSGSRSVVHPSRASVPCSGRRRQRHQETERFLGLHKGARWI